MKLRVGRRTLVPADAVPKLVDDAEELVVAAAVGRDLRVLDAGCGKGRMARGLAALGNTVDGIELSADAADRARPACRLLVHGSLTDASAWAQLGDRRYDVIVFSHVLEHLVDPGAVLDLAREHLASSGRFVIILPNVATWRMRWRLARGQWDYTDDGILDRTHLKFFTLKSARELLRDARFEITSEALLVAAPAGGAYRQRIVRRLRRAAPIASAVAFLFVARPSAGDRAA